MNKNGDKNEKSILKAHSVPIIVFIAVMIYYLSSFGSSLFESAKNEVYSKYLEEVDSVVELYNKEIYSAKKVAECYAVKFEYVDPKNFFDAQYVNDLKIISKSVSTANAYIVKQDMTAIDVNGNRYTDVSTISGFKSAIDKDKPMGSFITNAKGDEVVLVVAPIVQKNTLKGHIIFEFKPNIMATLTSGPKYSNNKTYALVTSDGTVVEITGHDSDILNKDINLFDNTDATFDETDFKTFKTSFTSTRTGYARIKKGEEDKYFYYAPIDDYYAHVVIGVSESDQAISYTAAIKTIRKYLWIIAAIVSAFVIVILTISLFNRAKFSMESEVLQDKADTDQLTTLYNKMATERLIKDYLAGEGKDKISMMFVLDIDNFKKINDTQGHAFGDKVLSSLGTQIKGWFRTSDIIGRIGGDEFIVFIKDVKDVNAVKREGSRIMQFFEGFNVGDYTRYSPTASVGGAVFPVDADNFDNLYKAADKAVYKSKRAGKNRVSFFGDLNKIEKEAETDTTGRD